MRWGVLIGIALSAGCASNRPVQLAVPAPDRETAMNCAMTRAGEFGYMPVGDAGVSSGFVRMRLNLGFQAGEAGKETATRVMTLGLKGVNSITADEIVIQGTGGQLRITAAGVKENGDIGKPRKDAMRQVEQILRACQSQSGSQP